MTSPIEITFETPGDAGARRPVAGEIHVWFGSLDDEADASALSADERARAARFHFEQDRRRFISGRAHLRRLLGEILDSSPESIRFGIGEHGKPYLPSGGIAFSFSRSGGHRLTAVAADGEVGIDLERVDPIPELAEVVRQNFSESERAAVCSCNGAERLAAFYEVWTRKEAVVKALGMGLTAPLQDFSVSVGPNPVRVADAGGSAVGAERLFHADLPLGDGFKAALAASMAPRVVKIFLSR